MNASYNDPVYYDPYNVQIVRDPYPVYRRLRNEAPLYYNEKYDFYAVSRYDDVQQGLRDWERLSSARSDIMELIKENTELPPGAFIWEDPPLHTAHRQAVQRLFTPKRMRDLEPQIREFTERCLDPLVGADRMDFVADLGAEMPMRVIGMLLGIPEGDLRAVRERADERIRTEAGEPRSYQDGASLGEGFVDYIDWRIKNPSNDVMTELLNAEIVDETGARRKMTREEVLTITDVLAGAGNETTNRLIGWSAKILGEHPEQRRELAGGPSLIPDAIEEILRYEPPGPHVARYVKEDIEFQGRTVPAGSVVLCLVASACRDERSYPDPDVFDIHRDRSAQMAFGQGVHTCIGNVLARLEGRIALEEVLKRFRDWEVDMDNARLSTTSTVRGWETMPVFLKA